jgi:hypothetical protein
MSQSKRPYCCWICGNEVDFENVQHTIWSQSDIRRYRPAIRWCVSAEYVAFCCICLHSFR